MEMMLEHLRNAEVALAEHNLSVGRTLHRRRADPELKALVRLEGD